MAAENNLKNTAESPAGKPAGNIGELPVEIIPEEPEKPAAKQLTEEQKRKRRRVRAFRSLVLRTRGLVLVVYILFFHLVGITIMPNGDMYPRIDAGDLVLYYRLEKDLPAQDIIVFEKPTASLEESYQEHKEMTAGIKQRKPGGGRHWIG